MTVVYLFMLLGNTAEDTNGLRCNIVIKPKHELIIFSSATGGYIQACML